MIVWGPGAFASLAVRSRRSKAEQSPAGLGQRNNIQLREIDPRKSVAALF
jgi:hypothetical protein